LRLFVLQALDGMLQHHRTSCTAWRYRRLCPSQGMPQTQTGGYKGKPENAPSQEWGIGCIGLHIDR
jgi:hypothetical protein